MAGIGSREHVLVSVIESLLPGTPHPRMVSMQDVCEALGVRSIEAIDKELMSLEYAHVIRSQRIGGRLFAEWLGLGPY